MAFPIPAHAFTWRVLFCGVVVALAQGCSITATPLNIQPSYADPCYTAPTFSMHVENSNVPGPFSLVAGYLDVNGSEIRMSGPASTHWGVYTYTGMVPNDGDIRFRYAFRYTTGVGGGTDHLIYEPQASYHVRPIGSLTWRSTAGNDIPDDNVTGTASRRPRKVLLVTEVVSAGVVGTRTPTEVITIQNRTAFPVTITAWPVIADRVTGAAIPEFFVGGVVGSSSASGLPITISGGGTTDLAVTFRGTLSTTTRQVVRDGFLTFPWMPGPCSFGPLWVSGGVFTNPP